MTGFAPGDVVHHKTMPGQKLVVIKVGKSKYPDLPEFEYVNVQWWDGRSTHIGVFDPVVLAKGSEQ